MEELELAFPVETAPAATPEALGIAVRLPADVDARAIGHVYDVVEAWFRIGTLGGFGGRVVGLDRLAQRTRLDGLEVVCSVDLTGAPRSSLDALLLALDGLARLEGVPVESVLLGADPAAQNA